MAEIDFFHYRPGETFLHRRETAVKYLSAIALSIGIFHASPAMLLLPALLMLGTAFSLGKLRGISRRKGFFILLFVIIVVRGLTSEGTPVPALPFLSIEGLLDGFLYSFRLFLLLIEGELLLSTTDPSELRGAVYRLLHPLPLIPAGTIATMISLSVVFIPLIFDQYREIRMAWDSRLGLRSSRSLMKITSLALPLMESVIGRAEEVASAMESRCYSDNPRVPIRPVSFSDVLFLVICFSFTVIILLLNP